MQTKHILAFLIASAHFTAAWANPATTFNPWSYQVNCRTSYLVIDTENDGLAEIEEHKLFSDLVKTENRLYAFATLNDTQDSQRLKIQAYFNEKSDGEPLFDIKITHFLNDVVQANVNTFTATYNVMEKNRFIHIHVTLENQNIVNAIEHRQPGEDVTPLSAAKKLYPHQKLVPWAVEASCVTSTIKTKIID